MTRKRTAKSRRPRANGTVAAATAKNDGESSDEEVLPTKAVTVIDGAEADDDLAPETDETGTFAALEVAPEDASVGGIALTSLQRLEDDIQELHSRWAIVEGELANRDMEIARLEEDRSIQVAAFKAQQAELDEAQIREQDLLAKIELQSGRLETMLAAAAQDADKLSAKDKQLADGESKLADLQAELNAARQRAQSIQDQLDAQREEFSDSREQVNGLKATIAELKVTITDLESYIDRRKQEWIQQTADLEQYRDALSGMERTLQDKIKEVSRTAGQNTELAAEIVQLQNRCSELDGRRVEHELANQKLQDRLAERASDIETLRQEVQAAEQVGTDLTIEVEKYSTELEEARNERSRLRSELEELRLDTERAKDETKAQAALEVESMREALDSAVEDANGMKLRLTDSESQITGLQAELEAEHVKLQQICDAAQAAETQLAGVVREQDQLESERDRLSTSLDQVELEFSDYRRTTAKNDRDRSRGQIAAQLRTRARAGSQQRRPAFAGPERRDGEQDQRQRAAPGRTDLCQRIALK